MNTFLDVDAVMVTGDWTYEPPRDLHTAFAPLRQLKMPVYGVLGNHDLEAPGANYASALKQALRASGVQLLDGQELSFKSWSVVGIGDLWGDSATQHIRHLLNTPASHRLIITHQPDTAASFPAHAGLLTLSGHTHGGQIRLPWITTQVLQKTARNPWYKGMYELPQGGKLLVTGGLGTIGLPARLGVRPQIELINLQPEAAPAKAQKTLDK